MPIAEIIHEIDAYLSRLRQARTLLSEGRAQEPKGRVPGGKSIARQAKAASSSKRRADEIKSRSNRPVPHLKKIKKRVDSSSPVSSAMVDHSPISKQPQIAEPERPVEQGVVITKLPARGRIRAIKSVRLPAANSVLGAKRNQAKPPIALARPVESKIVVVSAEQARREREQAAPPTVRRPRVPSSGLSGRLAFDALFNDEPDPSKASNQ